MNITLTCHDTQWPLDNSRSDERLTGNWPKPKSSHSTCSDLKTAVTNCMKRNDGYTSPMVWVGWLRRRDLRRRMEDRRQAMTSLLVSSSPRRVVARGTVLVLTTCRKKREWIADDRVRTGRSKMTTTSICWSRQLTPHTERTHRSSVRSFDARIENFNSEIKMVTEIHLGRETEEAPSLVLWFKR